MIRSESTRFVLDRRASRAQPGTLTAQYDAERSRCFMPGELLEELMALVRPSINGCLQSGSFLRTTQSASRRRTQGRRPSDVDATQRATVAQRLIAYDATHERASRVLMRALADLGDRAQAVREYQRCRSALNGTLDVEPSAETQALYAFIRSQTGRRDADVGTGGGSASARPQLVGVRRHARGCG